VWSALTAAVIPAVPAPLRLDVSWVGGYLYMRVQYGNFRPCTALTSRNDGCTEAQLGPGKQTGNECMP